MRVHKGGAFNSFCSHLARVFALVLLVFVLAAPVQAHAYKVKRGDTLSGLARRFGVKTAKIRRANHLASSRLKPGMRLRIPGRRKAGRHIAFRSRNAHKRHSALAGAGRVPHVKRRRDVYHKVRRGETLYSIARNYSVSVKQLRRLNGLGRRSRIRPGKKLLVMASGAVPKHYIIKKGDTFEKIARRYGLSAEALVEMNEMDSQDLRPGQKITLVEREQPEQEIKIQKKTGAPEVDAKTAKAIAAIVANSPASVIPVISAAPAAPDEIKGRIDALAGSKDIKNMSLKDKLMLFAKSMLNIPYRFGGTSFYGIDCSGFVQKVFNFLNIKLPRTAREQFTEGTPVKLGDLAVGDLLFFRTYGPFPSHVGIYIGENLFIHASPGGHRVKIASLDTPYFIRRLIGAKRLIPDSTESTGATPQPATRVSPVITALPGTQPALK